MSPGVIFTRARVSLALLSLRTNKGLLVVYNGTEGVAKRIEEKKNKYIEKHIQVYSEVQKIINEVHYVLKRKHRQG